MPVVLESRDILNPSICRSLLQSHLLPEIHPQIYTPMSHLHQLITSHHYRLPRLPKDAIYIYIHTRPTICT